LIVDAHADFGIGGDVVHPAGTATVLGDYPYAVVVGAAGERHAARLARLGSGGLQVHHQR
jgi:hypothetical protein